MKKNPSRGGMVFFLFCPVALILILLVSLTEVTAQPPRPTVFEGTLSLKKADRDKAGEIVSVKTATADKVTLTAGGKSTPDLAGAYRLELMPGTYPYLAETFLAWELEDGTVKKDRYWASGAFRAPQRGPATVTADLELILVEDSNDFCEGCHPAQRTKLGQHQRCLHDSKVPLKEIYKTKFAASGFALEKGVVVCITCHTPHLPTPQKSFLRKAIDNSQLCLSCHP